jgi:hypothetical protein
MAGKPAGSDWFSQLFGFGEPDHADDVRRLFSFDSSSPGTMILSSKVNGRSFQIGGWETPSLGELRARRAPSAAATSGAAAGSGGSSKPLKLSAISGDVAKLLSHKPARKATFQAASQFNCLEMVAPSVTPEEGITGYSSDRTQGPACSVAAGPATVFRNYLIRMPDGSTGQTENNQVHNAEDLLSTLGNNAGTGSGGGGGSGANTDSSMSVLGQTVKTGGGRYMSVVNGYTLATDSQLKDLNTGPLGEAALLGTSASGETASGAAGGGGATAAAAGPLVSRWDDLKCLVRVGAQTDTVVTSSNWGTKPSLTPDSGPSAHTVTQVFGSAPSVTYSGNSRSAWATFASLVLEASYESTLLIGLEAMKRHGGAEGSNTVYLTLLGGGVFGNDFRWIATAILEACRACADEPLDVQIVCYGGHVEREIQEVIKIFADEQAARAS